MTIVDLETFPPDDQKALRAMVDAAYVHAAKVRRSRLVTLEQAVRTVVERHGGIRAAERATGVDKSFISRLMSGKKVAPSAETLEALGLRAVPLYEVLKTPNAELRGRAGLPARSL